MSGMNNLRKRMAFAVATTSLIALFLSGCGSAPRTSGDDSAPTSVTDPSQEALPDLSEFEQQLPLTGTFVSQWTETVGSVEVARRDDGTVWVTLTDFRTGTSPDLRLYLNDGPLIKNADNHWTVDGSYRYEIHGTVSESARYQEFEVPGTSTLPEIHSVTVMDYALPDFVHFGSAALE